MNDLPKSVREQLARAQLPTSSHPDADLLTAYGENSLSAVERQRVTEHVAVCPECREVLFLAQPELDEAQFVSKAVPARRFGWMAWASAAAVVVVVGSAVMLQREKVVKVEPPVAVVNEQKPQEPKVAEEHKPAQFDDFKVPAETRERDSVVSLKPVPPRLDVSPSPVMPSKEVVIVDAEKKSKDDLSKIGGLITNENVQNSQNVTAGRQATSGPANTANAQVTNVFTANSAQSAAPAAVRSAQNVAPAAAPVQKQSKAELARDAAAAKTVMGYAQSVPDERLEGRAHWRISKAGVLERSYLADDWAPVLVGPGVKIRVVSVVGNIVWAGSDHGALYVSRNGGVDWAPLKIPTSADIVSIRFDDESNGAIQTSTGETWKTTDAGNSWNRQ
jgi:hypothetical protein